MKLKHVKRMLAIGLAAAMSLTLMAGCGKTNDDKGGKSQADGEATEDTTFGWWIYTSDGEGQYYETYEECAVAQWINQQSWDAENGGIGENGKKLRFTYTVPILGSENENFNTMIATGEYPEIIDMVVSSETPQAMHDNGIVMDITEYVEKYMPNYLAYLDANPELKPLVQTQEEDGSVHYYAIYTFLEGIEDPWQGTCYRRDWVVKYAEPTDYVWDWESDYVKENGHPAVTPLAKAKKEKNMEGWLDSEFNTRASDPFFQINSAGVNQGKVGMWDGTIGTIGTAIRPTCQNEEDARDAYVMGASLPINDVYGGEDQMYVEPDAMYQTSRKGTATAITTKAEGKDLATLFTFLDWTYTREGALVIRLGLNEEQYTSAKLDPDLYAEKNLKSAYTVSTDEDGRTVYTNVIDPSDSLVNALKGQRMDVGLKLQSSDDYRVDRGTPPINQAAMDQWTKYLNTGNVMDYTGLLNVEESEKYNKVSAAVGDYQNQYVPQVIKGTMSWEDYVKGFESIDPDSALEYLQKYVDLAKAK